MPKKVGKYELFKTLGEGTFGKVKYAINTETNEAVAIKVLDKEKIQKQNMGAQIKKEISIMKMVRHGNVVQLREVLASRTKIFIVLELVTGGELFDKIVAEGRLNEEQARFYFRQLVEGVEYCHSRGVCHRDLKPENLLLDEKGDLKVSDFGLSALYTGGDEASRTELLHTTCGTPNYVAPEVLADQGYDGRKADVWSIGVILYVLLAGFLPFDENTMAALFRKIQNADFTYPHWFTPQVRALLDRILVADPAVRIGLTEVKADPWFLVGGYDPPASETAAAVEAAAEAGEEAAGIEPTQEQLDDAVQEGAVEEQTAEVAAPAPVDGPKRLNAFELVNQCGGFAIERMFRTGSEFNQPRRVNQFTSHRAPQEIIEGVNRALLAMSCETRVFPEMFKIKATMLTPKNSMLGVVIRVYGLLESLQLVEVRRGKGDILEFHQFFQALMERLSPLVNAPAEGESKVAAK